MVEVPFPPLPQSAFAFHSVGKNRMECGDSGFSLLLVTRGQVTLCVSILQVGHNAQNCLQLSDTAGN